MVRDMGAERVTGGFMQSALGFGIRVWLFAMTLAVVVKAFAYLSDLFCKLITKAIP